MAKDSPGLYWHVHHDQLLEYCHDYHGRAAFILKKKYKRERSLRLRLFRRVRGRLPRVIMDAAYVFNRDRRAYEKAWNRREAVLLKVVSRRSQQMPSGLAMALSEAERACARTDRDSVTARRWLNRVLSLHELRIGELHARECRNCPWDGRTIFPE